MKKILILLLVVIAIFALYKTFNRESKNSKEETKRIKNHSKELKKLICSNNKYNKDIAFLIDMRIPSGKKRFFVYDLKQNKIIDKGLVAHGSGSETTIKGKLKFSNKPNSLSTSLGTYYVGKYYYGKFGKAYKLYGLDETNNNAFKRDIVFHYYYDVPYKEKDGYICNSYGCPMVNKKYFERTSKIIDASPTNILLSIYY
ncbi:murein L,D-transpeptidase catalytic domain-containing protein [Flavobacterium hungaricum]|uniref:L,D-transpeptidase catalytic domain n=1 Tax=Flavobacterium hungaricum TaxID=2082725 RepID=A0ABR9TIG0_9FLAO|nr:murein L,D-transpeptidase catalytic domain family protein [Flavobacterium hungaricum]MBE8724827.1 hypothetical protein [Flavobacterium hungaricum]